jgi:hypothetical protein
MTAPRRLCLLLLRRQRSLNSSALLVFSWGFDTILFLRRLFVAFHIQRRPALQCWYGPNILAVVCPQRRPAYSRYASSGLFDRWFMNNKWKRRRPFFILIVIYRYTCTPVVWCCVYNTRRWLGFCYLLAAVVHYRDSMSLIIEGEISDEMVLIFTWCSRMELEIHPWSCVCCLSSCHTYYLDCCGSGNVRASDWSSSIWSSGVSTCCALPCSGSKRIGSPRNPNKSNQISHLINFRNECFFTDCQLFHNAAPIIFFFRERETRANPLTRRSTLKHVYGCAVYTIIK